VPRSLLRLAVDRGCRRNACCVAVETISAG
jgi:hypothetical protein